MFRKIQLRRCSGFTLVELLVVIALLSLLVMIAVPRLISLPQKAREQVDVSNAVNIFKGNPFSS